MNDLTHIKEGLPAMVDVNGKTVTRRSAHARCILSLPPVVRGQFNGDDITTKKGSVFQTAIIAGIMAAKRTGELIPLCHPLALDHCEVKIAFNAEDELQVDCTAGITSKTGVEMEAI